MIIILFLAVYRVAAFRVRFHTEPWSKHVTMKNLFLELGWDSTLAFHVKPLGSTWKSIGEWPREVRVICVGMFDKTRSAVECCQRCSRWSAARTWCGDLDRLRLQRHDKQVPDDVLPMPGCWRVERVKRSGGDGDGWASSTHKTLQCTVSVQCQAPPRRNCHRRDSLPCRPEQNSGAPDNACQLDCWMIWSVSVG